MNPSISEMLLIARSCDIDNLPDAFHNYLRHYDLFFDIDMFEEQSNILVKQLIANGFTYMNDQTDKPLLKNIKVNECLQMLGINPETNIN